MIQGAICGLYILCFLCVFFQSVFASSIEMGTLRFADAVKSRHVMNVARLIVGSIIVSVFFTLCMCVLLIQYVYS